MSFDTSKTLQLQVKHSRRVRNLLIYMALVFMGAALVQTGFDDGGKGVMGTISLLVGLPGSITTAIRLIRVRNLVIEVGPEGIHDKRLTNRMIPWSDVIEISSWHGAGSTVLTLKLSNNFESTQLKSADFFVSKFFSLFVGVRGRFIDPKDLGMGFDALNKIVLTYAKAYNSPAMRD